jgi:hypothetical protein
LSKQFYRSVTPRIHARNNNNALLYQRQISKHTSDFYSCEQELLAGSKEFSMRNGIRVSYLISAACHTVPPCDGLLWID